MKMNCATSEIGRDSVFVRMSSRFFELKAT